MTPDMGGNLPPQRWVCPSSACNATAVTASLAVPYHPCPGLHGLAAPLVPEGTDAKVTAEERQDYLNGETQATGDDGKPYMAVRTIYADGHDDVAVNAGLAQAQARP